MTDGMFYDVAGQPFGQVLKKYLAFKISNVKKFSFFAALYQGILSIRGIAVSE